MNIDNDTKHFIIHRLKWSALFMGVGIILVFLLPFPLDFISVLGLLILVNFQIQECHEKIWRYGQNKRYVWFAFI